MYLHTGIQYMGTQYMGIADPTAHHAAQGQYRVKFLVDGEWRLAPEWPMENNEVGETNNVLEVK